MKYTKDTLIELCKNSTSVTMVMRKLNLKIAGGTHSYISKLLKKFNIDTSHFLGRASNFGKNHTGGRSKRLADTILVDNYIERERHKILKRALLELNVKHECVECGIGPIYNNKPITLQVDHINGDWSNNKIENLRFLCPNCHSQTPNHGGKKIKLNKTINKNIQCNNCIDCKKPISKQAVRCKSCKAILQQSSTSKRPTKEILEINLIETKHNICAIGRKYNVSDNAVRKWIRFYNLV
jgi:hypothetical protein